MTVEQKYFVEQLNSLVGGVIKNTIVDKEGFFGIEVEKANKRVAVWILMDEEGNGPGAVEIDPIKQGE